MIVKLMREGAGPRHIHMQECDGIHMTEYEDEEQGIIYNEVLCYRGGETVAEWHAGRRHIDHLFIMDKGKTADHIRCEPRQVEKQKQ